MHVLVNLDRDVCVVTSDLLPAKEEEEGTVLVFYMSPVHGCC